MPKPRLSESENISGAIEDYIKAIYQLNRGQGPVTTTALAEHLRVAPASVTGMLRKLADRKLVEYERYRGVSLTPEGEQIALRVVRYHRLSERYLAEVLGLTWDLVHAEADKWEHILSETVASRMDAAMGHPSTDPHGEPIPRADGAIAERDERRLSTLAAGQAAVVCRVDAHDPALLRYLGSLGIYPETELAVVDVAPFDGPVTVEVGGQRHALGRQVAGHIFVAASL